VVSFGFDLIPDPAGWQLEIGIPISSAARRGIFVESQPKQNQSPVGAAYSDDVAPERSFGVRNRPDYKDFAPRRLAGESGGWISAFLAVSR
jgi:hypothetical protein